MDVSEAKRLKALETENGRLKKLLAEALLEQEVTREVVRRMKDHGLTERHALRVVGMSASRLRYPRTWPQYGAARVDPDAGTPASAVWGRDDIYLKLRQRGERINHKRVERLYAEAGARRCPLTDRQPLKRPAAPNEVWSMDFVFDRRADGRVITCLTIVDDATHEAVAIVPERAIGGQCLTRTLDQLAETRGLPRVIRTDNGKEFCGRAMLTWAQQLGVILRRIEPGKPNQNAYIESFNGRRRDECLNEHWFLTLAHAQALIEAWRREYNEERPKKALGGLTPAAYARQLGEKSVTVAKDSNPGCYSKTG